MPPPPLTGAHLVRVTAAAWEMLIKDPHKTNLHAWYVSAAVWALPNPYKSAMRLTYKSMSAEPHAVGPVINLDGALLGVAAL